MSQKLHRRGLFWLYLFRLAKLNNLNSHQCSNHWILFIVITARVTRCFKNPRMIPAGGNEREIVESNITKSYLLGQLGAYSDHSSIKMKWFTSHFQCKKLLFCQGCLLKTRPPYIGLTRLVTVQRSVTEALVIFRSITEVRFIKDTLHPSSVIKTYGGCTIWNSQENFMFLRKKVAISQLKQGIPRLPCK